MPLPRPQNLGVGPSWLKRDRPLVSAAWAAGATEAAGRTDQIEGL